MKTFSILSATAAALIIGTSGTHAKTAEAPKKANPTKATKPASSADQALIDAAIAKVYPALVRIHVVAESPKDGRMQKHGGTGSGTIIHPDGYVLTNHHVAGDATRIWVRLSNKLKVDATLVGTDPQTDLCILKLNMDQIPAEMKPLPVAKFGNFKSLHVGDTVMAMGSPAGVSQSVTLGVVANLEMIIPNGGGTRQAGERVGDLVRWIGHDAVIYFGNSGGPLVNLKGEIIGINEIGLGSLGGAIPADLARYVASELIKHHSVRRSWTGLFPQPILRSGNAKSGVLVATVIKNSPADKAGLKPGDIITSFDGIKVNATAPEHIPLFNKVELGTPVGKTVEIKFIRDGKPQSTQLTTIERSKARGKDVSLPAWGITARNLTARSAIARRKKSTQGVLVTSINKTGAAASAKPALRPADFIVSFNGVKVNNIDHLKKLTAERTKNAQEKLKTIVEFERGHQLLATVVELNKQPSTSQSSAAIKAWVGIQTQVLTRDLAKMLNLKGKKGVRITQVIPNTNAAKAGLKQGDILLKIDGMVIAAEREQDANIFNTMIREYPANEKVEFDIIRNGKAIKLSCQLEPAPTPAKEFRSVTDNTLELTLRELSKAKSEEAKEDKGVYVKRVETSGWASLAGLKAGDIILSINGKDVTGLDMIEKELHDINKKELDYITLFVKRGNYTRFVEIHPIWNK